MKRIAAFLVTSLLTFTCGVTYDSFFRYQQAATYSPPAADVREIPANEPDQAYTSVSASDREIVFGGGRLRIVSEEVYLKSERLHYEINISYPQIIGTDESHIRRLNGRIKQLATDRYQWPLYPSARELLYYQQKHSDAFNKVDLEYQVILATDSILSIYFVGYSYGIGAAHSVQSSFTINYDLISGKELQLSDLFQPRSNYLGFMSRFCVDRLTKHEYGNSLFEEELAPLTRNFDSWNITREGIRFNFDTCKVFACSGGEQSVEIPFSAFRSIFSPRGVDFADLVRR